MPEGAVATTPRAFGEWCIVTTACAVSTWASALGYGPLYVQAIMERAIRDNQLSLDTVKEGLLAPKGVDPVVLGFYYGRNPLYAKIFFEGKRLTLGGIFRAADALLDELLYGFVGTEPTE